MLAWLGTDEQVELKIDFLLLLETELQLFREHGLLEEVDDVLCRSAVEVLMKKNNKIIIGDD